MSGRVDSSWPSLMNVGPSVSSVSSSASARRTRVSLSTLRLRPNRRNRLRSLAHANSRGKKPLRTTRNRQ
jgi:hypothetical protein